MKKKPNNLSISLQKRPISASGSDFDLASTDTRSMTGPNISCLIQKSLESLLKRENFFKSPDLTRISQQERNRELILTSAKIRLSNKSAEYHEIPFFNPNPEYEKFKTKYQKNITSNKGFFLYTQNPTSRKSQSELIGKVTNENMNWDAKSQYKQLLKKRINNNGKVTIVHELKEKSMNILKEALEMKVQKGDLQEYKTEVEKKLKEMTEQVEKVMQEK